MSLCIKVIRGLTQAPYLAMVIQSSLLTFIHEKSSLAAAIVQIFEREADEADSSQHRRAVPSQEGIFGVFRACEDQTSAYNWKGLILAVATTLDISEPDALEPIPSIVLQGAVHTFPLVQSLPDDRIVLIDTHEGAGACCLLVCVLGLTVLVRKHDHENSLVERQFGSGNNHVVLDLRDKSLTWIGTQSTLEIRQPSITLLSVSDNEPLLVLKSESDEVAIDATYKQPARGYGRKILEHECSTEAGREALIHELSLLALAFAAILSQHLYTRPRSAFYDNTPKDSKEATTEGMSSRGQLSRHEQSNEGLRCQVPEYGLIRSARFLFNEPSLSLDLVEGHRIVFSRQPLNSMMDMPRSISLMLDQNPPKVFTKEDAWRNMLKKVRYLSIVLLTFAFVKDLEDSSDLPLSLSLGPLGQGDLMNSWNNWDGRSNIWIPEDCWFLVLARLLVGHKGAIDSTSTCLVSDRGWSIFLSTFGDADPWFTDAGHVVVRKGIPCRGGVRKHSVSDGPGGGFGENWQVVHTAGQGESLRCLDAVYPSKPLCGDRHGSFLVNLRFSLQTPARKDVRRTGWKEDVGKETETRRTGYRELFAALWGVQRTEGCQHESSELTLPL